MPTTPVTIDLGQLPQAEEPRLVAPPSGSWHRSIRRSWRTWATAAVVGLLVLSAAAAAGPRPPWAVIQYTIPAGDTIIGEDRYFVVDADDTGHQRLTARRIEDGAAAWEITASSLGSWFSVEHGVPLELTVPSDPTSATPIATTTVRDPETGQARWTYDGSVTVIGDSGLAVVTGDGESSAVVDVATGREVWRLPPTRQWGYDWWYPEEASQLAVATLDGDLVSYDLTTGEVVATAPGAVPGDPSMIQIVDPLVLVNESSPQFEELTITAFDMHTLDHRWTANQAGGGLGSHRCGALLCVIGATQPYALDPATGGVVWSVDSPISDSRALVWLPGRTGWALGPRRILDAATGEPVLELGDWELAPRVSPTSDVLLTRYEQPAEREAAGRTWFGLLRDRPARVEVLGTLPGRLTDCQLTAARLVCSEVEQLHVWRVRLP